MNPERINFLGEREHWDDSPTTHDVAMHADSVLEFAGLENHQHTVIQGDDRREPLAQLDINYAIDYSRLAIRYNGKDGNLSDVSQGVRRNIADLVLPEESLENRIILDKLTGLPNQSMYLHNKVAANGDPSKNFVFFDANNFKHYNDTYGHAAGDALLTLIARALEGAAIRFKGSDIYRVGGDEFAIITKTRKLESLMLAGESAVQKAIESMTPLKYGDNAEELTTHQLKDFSISGGYGETSHTADMHMLERKNIAKFGENAIIRSIRKATNQQR
jgi:diguanylate cyclase (GGDEF)-like protein